jgi:murein DD-endopeptidase MepM/ murein hydrolase activator NlpD
MQLKKFEKNSFLQYLGIFITLLLLLSSCSQHPTEADLEAARATMTAVAEIERQQTLAVTPTVEQIVFQDPTHGRFICTPLRNVDLLELDSIITNPFYMTALSNDDGHHGTDFGFYQFENVDTMMGLPIYAIMSGKVVGVLDDKLPYGYTVITETPLASLPESFLEKLNLPDPIPPVEPNPALTCPEPVTELPDWQQEDRSLYILYAHMYESPLVNLGDKVICGQHIGGVGTTGKSVNEHLHLEIRVGPSGYRIPSLCHYTTTCSYQEFVHYCTWRVTGIFQAVDPMPVLLSDFE